MRSFLVTLAATAALVAAQLRIETPTNLVVCQPALLAWQGGSKPYYVAVIPGGEPTGAALKDFGQTDDNSRTWNVDLPAGQSVSLRITDSTGAINYSEKVTIREGSSTSCLNGASASGSSAASGAAVSASSAASGAASSAGGAVSSASSAAASATGAARSAASSGTAAAGTAASRVSSAAGGAASNATSAGNAAASAASGSVRPSNAASFGAKVQTAGVFGAVAAIFGVALF